MGRALEGCRAASTDLTESTAGPEPSEGQQELLFPPSLLLLSRETRPGLLEQETARV